MQTPSQNQLTELAAGVWYADAEMRMPGGALLPIRMTVLQLADGGLLIHSPVKLRDDLATKVAEKGPVRFILAPNGFHHLYFGQWQKRFPDAVTYGPRILAKKRPDLKFDHYHDELKQTTWEPAIQWENIEGIPKLQELVLYHRPSRTLVLTDLVFNIKKASGFLKWLLRVMGTYQKLSCSRLVRFMIRDRSAYNKSIERVLALPVEHLIMAHGDLLKGKACEALRQALIK